LITTESDEHVLHGGGVGGVVGARVRRPDPQQRVGPYRAGVDQEAGEPHTVDVGHVQGVDAAVGDDGGESQTQHDRVRPVHLDGPVEVVDTGREQQVESLREGGVDGRGRRAGLDDVELAERQGGAAGVGGPGHAAGVGALAGHEHLVLVAVQVEERLLA
jgi:hypothetical protein